MRRNIIFIFLGVIAVILSYQIELFEFVLLTLICLSVIFLIPVGVIFLFRRINLKLFKVPFAIICICLAGVFTALLRPYAPAIRESGSMSEKLKYAYKTDQKDRMILRSYIFSDMKERDEVRLNQVKEFYEQEKKLNPMDKFHSAFIYHHSNNSSDFAIASKLATAAAKSPELVENYQVQWLSKAAYDRWMLSIGKPEKYNTQENFSLSFE